MNDIQIGSLNIIGTFEKISKMFGTSYNQLILAVRIFIYAVFRLLFWNNVCLFYDHRRNTNVMSSVLSFKKNIKENYLHEWQIMSKSENKNCPLKSASRGKYSENDLYILCTVQYNINTQYTAFSVYIIRCMYAWSKITE